MGIDYHTARWIVNNRPSPGDRVLTIGRQNWWLSKRESRKLGLRNPPAWARDNYADWFFDQLNLNATSMDLCPDENPTYVQDLSHPDAIHPNSGWDVVMDFGTAEHVADQKVYWFNLYKATYIGGMLWGMLPANSLCGHGLYQFSPEFFFNMRGFVPLEISIVTYSPIVRWREVSDLFPGRFTIRSFFPTYVAFRLVRRDEPFELPTQYQNATSPTSKPTPGARFLAEIPGIRILERILL